MGIFWLEIRSGARTNFTAGDLIDGPTHACHYFITKSPSEFFSCKQSANLIWCVFRTSDGRVSIRAYDMTSSILDSPFVFLGSYLPYGPGSWVWICSPLCLWPTQRRSPLMDAGIIVPSLTRRAMANSNASIGLRHFHGRKRASLPISGFVIETDCSLHKNNAVDRGGWYFV